MRRLLIPLFVGATLTLVARLGALHPIEAILAGIMLQVNAPPIHLPYPAPPPPGEWKAMPVPERLQDVQTRLLPQLHAELALKQLKLGQPAFIRIFKETSELELWLRDDAKAWKRFRTYPIACFSGLLGPKQREGDMQAPEGFYAVTKRLLNPASSYHLAFNIGYPNAYDLHHLRTGNLIMIHGDQVSIGCFAMTDPIIEEIYAITAAALEKGQTEVSVHSFPFRMTEARMQQARAGGSPWLAFWENLREGHDLFETSGKPPAVVLEQDRYSFQLPP